MWFLLGHFVSFRVNVERHEEMLLFVCLHGSMYLQLDTICIDDIPREYTVVVFVEYQAPHTHIDVARDQ